MRILISFLLMTTVLVWDASAFTKRARTTSGTATPHRHGSREVCEQNHDTLVRSSSYARDIQRVVASQGGPGSSALVNKAMSQIACPTRNIGKGAGRCATNGYRASTYDCAYYVRKALEGTQIPAGTGGLGHAKDMGCRLKSFGFKNLCGDKCAANSPTCNLNPYAVPEGAVLVYANVGRGCHWAGHAEIRTRQGFVSDYFSARPRNEGNSCRRLIGVWTK